MDQRTFAENVYDPRGINYDDSHHPEFATFLVEHAALRPGEHVLDLACGTGLVTFPAALKVGASGMVVGVDVSQGMLAEARKKHATNPAFTIVSIHNHDVCDLANFDAIQGMSFDCAIMASAFVLMKDPVACAEGVRRYLKPGGRFVVDVTTPYTLPAGLALELTGKKLGIPVGYNTAWSDSPDAVRKVLEKAGFSVKDVISRRQTNVPRTFDIKDFDAIFNQQVQTPALKYLAEPDVVSTAKQTFREIFASMAKEGKVNEENMVWVATALNKI